MGIALNTVVCFYNSLFNCLFTHAFFVTRVNCRNLAGHFRNHSSRYVFSLKYSKSPTSPPDAVDKNHANDIAVAISGLTPAVPNKKTNAPSLSPIPDMETGSVEIVTIIGK